MAIHYKRVQVDDITQQLLDKLKAQTGLDISGYLRVSVHIVKAEDLINPKAVRTVAEEGQEADGALDTAEVETN